MAFIATIPPRRAAGETRAAYRAMRDLAGVGKVAQIIQLFSVRPAAMRHAIRAWELGMWTGGEPRAMREFVGAGVSRLNDCHYWIDAHEAFLQAAGGDASRVADVLDGRVTPTPLEGALATLMRKAHETPAKLAPSDLDPVRALAGNGALEYALVLGTFHFVNRMADLLHVDPEVPGIGWIRRVEPLRRGAVRMMSVLLGRMDLAVRPYDRSFDEVTATLPPHVDRAALAPLRARPHVIEALALGLDAQATSSLDRATVAQVQAVVEAALPASADDLQGFHARPSHPVDAFAFVGTRYASRTTAPMIDALRARGFDDLGLLDLAIAVSSANQWARLWRLLGLRPALLAATAA